MEKYKSAICISPVLTESSSQAHRSRINFLLIRSSRHTWSNGQSCCEPDCRIKSGTNRLYSITHNISSKNNTNFKKYKEEQKDVCKKEIKKFSKRKIEEMEQDEEVIFTISKNSNISINSLQFNTIKQKFCYSQMMNTVSDSSQQKKKEKLEKYELNQINFNYFNFRNLF